MCFKSAMLSKSLIFQIKTSVMPSRTLKIYNPVLTDQRSEELETRLSQHKPDL